MKKNLKRNFKRWIAFVLAVVIIMTTCVYSSDAYLRATDNPEQTEAVQEPTVVTDTIVPEDIPEEVIEEETDEPEEEEEIQQETPEEEVEDTSDDDEPEEPEPIPNDETEENEEKPADTPEASPEENPEETPEESPEASPIETPEGEPTPIPSPEATATPSATPTASPEKEEAYGYAVYYYFDGVEDKSVRVEKEDGVLGEAIVTSVESAVVHNGKDYVLDYVENENGKVSDNPDNNIVRIYYVLAEEDAKVYTVVLEHILSTDNLGTFRSEETIRLTDKDLADGSVNLIDRAYSRDGMECVTGEVVLSKDDFDSGYQAFARIDYGVADGWVAVLRGSGSAPASGGPRRARAVYVGKIDDVEFVKAGQIPVSISFVYEDGSIAHNSETVMVEEDNGRYLFSHSFDAIAGYEPELDSEVSSKASYNISEKNSEGKYQITAELEFSEDMASGDSVGVVFKAGEGSYQVVTRIPTKGNKSVTDDPATYTEITKTFTDKKVGELTEVEAEAITGFTPKAVKQQTVTGDGTTEVIVEYVRNNYTVTYDTQGGSYVKAEKWLYEDEAEVYSGEKGTPGNAEVTTLTCEKEEHTHSWQNGCYNRRGSLTCKKEEHTHSSSCYSVTPAVPSTPSTFAPAPTRQGYTFTGWYRDAACTKPAEKTIASIDSDVTVYAGWEAKEVNYTVVYLKEIWDNGSSRYAYVSSTSKTAEVGTTVSGSNRITVDSYHEYSGSTSETVKADGSTVVEVRYALKKYTIVFNLDNQDAKLKMDGTTYKGSNYKIENVVLGQSIADKWPTSTNITGTKDGNSFYSWQGDVKNYVTKVFEVTEELLGNGAATTVTYTATWETGSKRTVQYWLENADDSDYSIASQYSQELITNYGLSPKEIYGFTCLGGNWNNKPSGNNYPNAGLTGSTYNFYYRRNASNITYKNVDDTEIQVKSGIKFGADISGSAYNFTPARPDGMDTECSFAGWYDNNEGAGEPYKFTTMPEGGLALYAIWTVPEKTVTIIAEGSTTPIPNITVKKGEIANVPTPEREGYSFEGWFTADGKEFDINEPIMEDVTIYAHWSENTETEYTVRHVVIENGAEIEVKDTVSVMGTVGDTVSARAAKLDGNYKDYVADANEKSIVLGSAESENVITFVYSPLSEIKYCVEYVYNGVIKDKQENIEAKTKSFRVYPDADIKKSLNEAGYKIKEGLSFVQANLTADNATNVVKFELETNNYTISYKGIDDETKEELFFVDPGNQTSYTVVSEDIQLKNPSVDGYDFVGWTTNGTVDGQSQAIDKNIEILTGSRGHLEFTAHFKKKAYNMTASAVNGTISPKSGTVRHGGSWTVTFSPNEGYKFAGINIDGNPLEISEADKEAYSGSNANYTLRNIKANGSIQVIYERDTREFSIDNIDKVYDGNDTRLSFAGTARDGERKQYSENDGATWTDVLDDGMPVEKNVTDKSVMVRVVSSENEVIWEGTTTVKITRRPVTVTAVSASKVFGTNDPKDGFTATVAGVIGSDAVEYTVSRKPGENVGTYDIIPTGEAEQGNYSVKYEKGTFTITAADRKKALSVTSYSDVYDGEAHTITLNNRLDGDKVEYSYDGGITWNDSLTDYTDVTRKEGSDDNVQFSIMVKVTNPNYQPVENLSGSVLITPKEATVTANDTEKVYGAKDPEFTARQDGLVEKDKGKITLTYEKIDRQSGEDVGDYTLTPTGKAVQGNYAVTFKPGTLTIIQGVRPENKKPTISDYSDVYDAKNHTISIGNKQEGDSFSYSYDGGTTWEAQLKEYKDVTADEGIPVQVKVTNKNYTEDLILTGNVKITPFEILVKAEDKTKVYKVPNEEDPELTATVNPKNSGQTKPDNTEIRYDIDRDKGEDAGPYKITPTGKQVQGNYKVTFETGTLTITAGTRTKQPTVTGYKGEYDANEHTITVGNLETGDVVWYSYDKGASWTKELEKYQDVTNKEIQVKVENPNYAPEKVGGLSGTVEITRRPVTVTAVPDSKVYGDPDPEFTATVAGTLGNDTVVYTVSRVQGEAVDTYDIIPDGKAEQGNYIVTYESGTFTINPADRKNALTVTSYSEVYDGEAHSITLNNRLADDTVEYSYDGGVTWSRELTQYTDVTRAEGSDENVRFSIKVKVTNPNYKPVESEGSVLITPKAATVKAKDETKVYGEADPKFTATQDGLVPKDREADFKLTYREIERQPGEDVGEYKLTPTGNAVQGNYAVTFKPGTLTITQGVRPENKKPTISNYSDVYDAGYHTISIGNRQEGDTFSYSYDGGKTWEPQLKEYKDVTADEGIPVQVKVTNKNYKEDLTLTGNVKITPFEIVVKAEDKSKVYKVPNEKDPDFTATVNPKNSGQTKPDNTEIRYDIDRDEGEDAGPYKITPTGAQVQGNYKVTFEEGTLTITAGTRTKQPTVTGYKNPYDANEHTITVNDLEEGDVVWYSYDGGASWTKELKKYKDVTNKEIQVKVENPNYAPAEVGGLSGTVEITRKPVTVTAVSASKVFGTKDPEEGFKATVAGTLGSDTVKYTVSRKLGENVGTYDITPTGEAEQGNYSVKYEKGIFTITAADRKKALSVTSYSDVYDGEAHTITLNNRLDSDKVEYSYDGGITWNDSLTDYTDVTRKEGSDDNVQFSIMVKVTNPNYQPVENLTGTVLITPRATTVTADNQEKVYGDDDPKFTATASNVLVKDTEAGFELAYTKIERQPGEEVGTYELTPTGEAAQGNYIVTFLPGKLTITDKGVDVNKVVTKNHDGSETYALNETIVFTIQITNIYNEAKTITVKEQDGVTITGQSVFENVEPGTTVSTTASYTVSEEDILKGSFTNKVDAEFSGISKPYENTDEVTEIDDINPDYTIAKSILGIRAQDNTMSAYNADAEYKVGDVIVYEILVESKANVTLENVVVTDILEGAVGTVDFGELPDGVTKDRDNNLIITKLAPASENSESKVRIVCEYEITRADAGNSISNSVTAKADDVKPAPENPNEEPKEPPKPTDETDEVKAEDIYTLTISYLFADGTEAADTVTAYYLAGETYVVASPVIAGYNSSLAAVTGVMPDRDVNVTVVYSIPTPPTPPTPDEPEPTPTISPEPPTPPTPDEPEPPAPPVPPTPDEPEPPVEPIVDPAAPVVPGPAAAAAVQVVIPAALTAVGDEEVPLEGALIDVDDDGNVTVIPIEEEEIPLDNRELDDHKCCILSFLLMLATLIIYSWFTHSMKKRQKKLAELKDQLAEETLKRQLGIADTKESAR